MYALHCVIVSYFLFQKTETGLDNLLDGSDRPENKTTYGSEKKKTGKKYIFMATHRFVCSPVVAVGVVAVVVRGFGIAAAQLQQWRR